MIVKKNYVRAVGFLLLIVILLAQDFDQLKSTIIKINIPLFLIGLLLIFPYILFRALRWNLIMKYYDIKIDIIESTTIYFSALFTGLASPGRLGEFIKIFYISEKGNSYSVSFVTVLLDRLWDICTLLVIGFIGLYLFKEDFHLIFYSYSFSILGLIFIWKSNLFHFKNLKFNFLPKYVTDNYEAFLSRFYDFKSIDIKSLFNLIVVNIMGWIVYFVQAYILALSLSLDVDFLFLVLVVSISGLVTLLPITFSGIGTRDAVFIFMFDKIGISSELALAFSFAILLTYLFNGFIGFLAWQIKPIKGFSDADIS